jgi:hypothetical protein
MGCRPCIFISLALEPGWQLREPTGKRWFIYVQVSEEILRAKISIGAKTWKKSGQINRYTGRGEMNRAQNASGLHKIAVAKERTEIKSL